jgi:hypothetical protein
MKILSFKKIIFTFIALFFSSSVLYASVLEGLSVSGGLGVLFADDNYGSIASKFIEDGETRGWHDGSSSRNSGRLFQYGIEVSYERKGLFDLGEKHLFGVKVGYRMYNDSDVMQEIRYDKFYGQHWGQDMSRIFIKSESYSVPVSVYYSRFLGTKWKFSAGVGITFLTNKFTGYSSSKEWDNASGSYFQDYVYEATPETDNLIIPTINVGFEYLMCKYLGLYTDYGWNFGGKATTPYVEDIEKDYSGFNFTVGVRVYVP